MMKKSYFIAFIFVCLLTYSLKNNRSNYTTEVLNKTWITGPMETSFEYKPKHFSAIKSFFLLERAFNPSMIKVGDRYLIMYRHENYTLDISKLKLKRHHNLEYQYLDTDLNPLSPAKPLHLTDASGDEIDMQFAEDPRIIEHDSNYYLFYTRAHYIPEIRDYRNTQNMCQLDLGSATVLTGASHQLNHPTIDQLKQKNWIPFSHEGELLVIYTASPFELLQVDLNTHILSQYHSGNSVFPEEYGFIFGSTPTVKVDDKFLTIYHTHVKSEVFHTKRPNKTYVFGAYLFSPDWEVLSYTPPLLGTEKLYSNQINHRRICFPSSLIPLSDDEILLAMGVNDCKIFFVKMSVKALLNEMKP